jgi:hypothetical protein
MDAGSRHLWRIVAVTLRVEKGKIIPEKEFQGRLSVLRLVVLHLGATHRLLFTKSTRFVTANDNTKERSARKL